MFAVLLWDPSRILILIGTFIAPILLGVVGANFHGMGWTAHIFLMVVLTLILVISGVFSTISSSMGPMRLPRRLALWYSCCSHLSIEPAVMAKACGLSKLPDLRVEFPT
jgi:hypothetical protein